MQNQGLSSKSRLTAIIYVFIRDIVLMENHTKICNYAHDITIFAFRTDLDTIIIQLEEDSSVIVKWFSGNF